MMFDYDAPMTSEPTKAELLAQHGYHCPTDTPTQFLELVEQVRAEARAEWRERLLAQIGIDDERTFADPDLWAEFASIVRTTE